MINRAHERCQNVDKEGVPSSSGIHIIDEETESDEYECGPVRQLNHGIPTCCHAFSVCIIC